MGEWISSKVAGSGYRVVLSDIDENQITRVKKTHEAASAPPMAYESRLGVAVKGADLVIETIVEDLSVKTRFFSELEALVLPSTTVTSNSSILSPTNFLKNFTSRQRFACLHFYSPNTIVEIMPIDQTAPSLIAELTRFVESIGETPILLKKTSPGYVFSAMAGAATDVALDLAARGVAELEAIDRAWKILTGMKIGPFGMLDMIGLDTSLRIRKSRLAVEPDNAQLKRGIEFLEKYVNGGKLGIKSKSGFYPY